jgi:hypothetical protein
MDYGNGPRISWDGVKLEVLDALAMTTSCAMRMRLEESGGIFSSTPLDGGTRGAFGFVRTFFGFVAHNGEREMLFVEWVE